MPALRPAEKPATCLKISDSQVIALDVSEQRLSRIKENLVRLGFAC